ncbi:MAG: HlyD family secretion protein [Pseudoxanthomonas sp.]|nr:HlyD family secretion protein [Pseudoxanthomonas sp.]
MSENGQAAAGADRDGAAGKSGAVAGNSEGAEAARTSVRRGGRIVVGAIVASLLLYLVADRYTPYTSQARIDGFVVGIAPKVAGAVVKLPVGNDQAVKAGEVLFEIDPSQYRIALAKAESDLAHARRQVGAGSAAVEAARAGLRAVQANELKARQDATRLRRLREEDPGTVSVRRQEVADATLQQATAQVAAAEADIRRAIDQMGGDSVDDNTVLQTALTAVEKAQLDLANTRVTAPSDGVVTDLGTDVGLYAGAGSPVLTLVAIHDMWINAEFTENNLGHIKPGTPVDIVFDAMPGHVFKGKVRSIGLGVGSGSSAPAGTLPSVDNDRDWLRQSQRFPVIVGFDPNQDPDLRAALRVGGQASVIAYGEGSGLTRLLGKLYIRAASLLTYAY